MKYNFLYTNIIFIGDKMLKNYIKSSLINILSIIISIFILTIFNYSELLNNNIIDILKLLIVLISVFINSYIIGKNSKNKGYLEGLKFGSIFIIFILLYNLLFISKFNFKIIIYYILILITSMVASTIGINRKK